MGEKCELGGARAMMFGRCRLDDVGDRGHVELRLSVPPDLYKNLLKGPKDRDSNDVICRLHASIFNGARCFVEDLRNHFGGENKEYDYLVEVLRNSTRQQIQQFADLIQREQQ